MHESICFAGNAYFREGEAFYINRVHEPKKEQCVFHTHDFMEICYVAAGRGCHMLGGRSYTVHKGDLFVINYHMAHAFYRSSDTEPLITYNLVFKPDFLDYSLIGCGRFDDIMLSYLFRNLDVEQAVKEDLRLDAEEQKDFDLLIDGMYREYGWRQEGYVSILRAQLIELIVNLIRCLHKRTGTAGRCDSPVIRSAVAYLQENYAKAPNLAQLSLQCFLSKSSFCKLFKKTTGMTLSDYTQMLRVDEACKLLETTDRKLTDIALEVGFSDYKFFGSVFKRIKGMRPSDYKRLRQEEQNANAY